MTPEEKMAAIKSVFEDKEHWEKHPELWGNSTQTTQYDYLKTIQEIIDIDPTKRNGDTLRR